MYRCRLSGEWQYIARVRVVKSRIHAHGSDVGKLDIFVQLALATPGRRLTMPAC